MHNKIREDYYEWLIGYATSLCDNYGSYSKLLDYLYSREFEVTIPNDDNRVLDGLDLRTLFADSTRLYTYRDVYNYLNQPCSVLEVMVALAKRIEEYIMGDLNDEDRTYIWFYGMLKSLHLDGMNDYFYDERTVKKAIDILLNHEYSANGNGGLFTIHNPDARDFRYEEIWYQMSWYLDECTENYI